MKLLLVQWLTHRASIPVGSLLDFLKSCNKNWHAVEMCVRLSVSD